MPNVNIIQTNWSHKFCVLSNSIFDKFPQFLPTICYGIKIYQLIFVKFLMIILDCLFIIMFMYFIIHILEDLSLGVLFLNSIQFHICNVIHSKNVKVDYKSMYTFIIVLSRVTFERRITIFCRLSLIKLSFNTME